MKIGVIGAGNIGTALAKRLVPQGHSVMLSFARDASALARAAESFGATSGTPEQAVKFGDVVVLATPWDAVKTALDQAGPLDKKIVWDCTNALKPDLSGLQIGTTDSAGETVQRLAPSARVVKGIPPFAELLHSEDPTLDGKPSGCFLCGDDADAKAVIRPLMEALPATVTDAGPLENARYVEAASFLLVRLAYGLGMGSRIGLALHRAPQA